MKTLLDKLTEKEKFDEGSSSEGSDGGVEQACCLNCGTPGEEAYIYCEHFQKVMEMKSFDETGETTACSKWTNAERNGQ